MSPPPIAERDEFRLSRFGSVWKNDLDDIFVDVAPYYDRANRIASLGLWDWFSRRFMAMIDLQPGERVLDVCAGTNAVGIALLKREPTLTVHAIDRSAAMQEVGRQRAEALGLHIDSTIGDVHVLPFPDNHFDVITLQWASRHLRVHDLFREIHRVLKPGGHFHHCDMLRPGNPVVEKLYYGYLRLSLPVTGLLYRSGRAAMNAQTYFIDALEAFYTTEELSEVLRGIGYCEVEGQSLLGGMVGLHRAVKGRPGGPCPGVAKHRPKHGSR
ncbi:methyltransferase domain-containing protein [Parasulfuritortus cantonensis]|uniref:Methyltransferase domain-containing protein n=1 Tax=Parasulfuritortus cantonensis TaxID=2528202 RepID=A0A4R1BLD7_9PROT|nr:class I SAM-dependent methyltransferase [Parasulfuritortus cantonensis]TCJ18184.1 methyltransferase domain-containing protein [Parasulfuritortus cantonensis]